MSLRLVEYAQRLAGAPPTALFTSEAAYRSLNFLVQILAAWRFFLRVQRQWVFVPMSAGMGVTSVRQGLDWPGIRAMVLLSRIKPARWEQLVDDLPCSVQAAVWPPRVELDREGNSVTLTYLGEDGKRKYIYDYQSHPALKAISDFVSRLGLSMGDLGMTVRAADPEEDEQQGVLKLDDKTRETLSDFNARMMTVMAGAKDMLAAAQKATREDPVLVAHEAREGKS